MKLHHLILATATLLSSGGSGPQSALSHAGLESESNASLFWWMSAGAGIVWLGVMLLRLFVAKKRETENWTRKGNWITVGWAATPAGVLAVLLVFGLAMLPELLAVPSKDTLRIHVTAEEWWWRFRYELPGRIPFETANEVWLPVGQPVEFLLQSNNVIHSFWIPSLGGKMDVMPGRENRLVLHPTITGTFLGACTEYCGIGHSKMAMQAIVVPEDAFRAWLDTMRGAAQP